MRIEGNLLGFDEYMNVVLDDSYELELEKKTKKFIGKILLKGENICLISRVGYYEDYHGQNDDFNDNYDGNYNYNDNGNDNSNSNSNDNDYKTDRYSKSNSNSNSNDNTNKNWSNNSRQRYHGSGRR